MSTQVLSPYPLFTTLIGAPLTLGYVYIGEANQDPETHPQAAFWDIGLTTPAIQPMRTNGGYILNAGNAATVYTDGAFSIRVRDKNGVQVFYRANVPDADALKEMLEAFEALLAGSTGSTLVGHNDTTVAEMLDRVWATPEEFGATGYASATAALAGIDCTALLQTMADEAANAGRAINGNGRWYKAGTVSWPSSSYVQNLKCVVPNASSANAPFFVDGQTAEKSNITFIDCEVDGNRIGQTLMTSGIADGNRGGFKLFGRLNNIKLVRPKAYNVATDGIFIWSGSAVPANGTDYLAVDVQISDPDVAFCGRHGISTNSLRSFRLTGGRSYSNGFDAVGWTPSGNYADGGYGRRSPGNLGGNLYGRGFTFESFNDGDGYDGLFIDGLDARANVGGVLIHHVFHATSARDLRITNCELDGPVGGSGDGSLVLYCVHDGLPYTGTDGFVGVYLEDNSYSGNWVSLSCCDDIYVSGGYADINPAFATDAISLTHHGDVRMLALPSNKRPLGFTLPVALIGITQTVSTGWTVNSSALSFVRFNTDGSLRLKLVANITPDAAEKAQFDAEITSGWSIQNDYSINSLDDNVEPIVSYATASGAANNKVSFGLKSLTATPISVQLWFSVAKA